MAPKGGQGSAQESILLDLRAGNLTPVGQLVV